MKKDKYKCNRCRKEFESKSEMRKHRRLCGNEVWRQRSKDFSYKVR